MGLQPECSRHAHDKPGDQQGAETEVYPHTQEVRICHGVMTRHRKQRQRLVMKEQQGVKTNAEKRYKPRMSGS